MPSSRFLSGLAIAIVTLVLPVLGQVSTPCSPAMISSFTPCFNFITNSSANGTISPSTDCCSSLKLLANTSVSCLCLIMTANVPIQLPINRTLAISLPRACNMPGLPVQCKASGAPIPAPGPMALGPTSSAPGASPTASPTASAPAPVPEVEPPPALPPVSDTPPVLTPPSPPATSTTPGSRPVVNPPAASGVTHVPSPTLFLPVTILGSLMMKFY
ncbi:sulfated surface glycoprotein 185-like [Punica granatum]|uniref:Bifunctional inhibitor/plant lipid transfer protein/seed storage helical domain-containing protein n=2 Tax=Punica granatum TaxID=22663 RepID=A0A218WP92_PUNGR|nr:sulfated surface glycoprotein 185-like [Punica granatum]OWM74298.1 hypothetical protein CDL15_Pgr008612 [Punica granatum]PKI39493.1 hypothetical protein CRG98_040102 [Punica granatum]